jgi:hypothetical protein
MKKFLKVMLALTLVAGTLFTNAGSFVGADTAITAEAASSKNPRYEGRNGNRAIVSYQSSHKIKSVTINGKNANYVTALRLDNSTRNTIAISLVKGSNRVEVRDNKGYWVVFYVNR